MIIKYHMTGERASARPVARCRAARDKQVQCKVQPRRAAERVEAQQQQQQQQQWAIRGTLGREKQLAGLVGFLRVLRTGGGGQQRAHQRERARDQSNEQVWGVLLPEWLGGSCPALGAAASPVGKGGQA
jgi:hypothetical protein